MFRYVLFLICLVSCSVCAKGNDFTLKQVLILSRHNLRTPLSPELEKSSPKPWPAWNEESGYLTAKGALLEGYMGKYFSEWLKEKNLLSNTCPDDSIVYVYANTKQRTLATAWAFVKKAFPNCNVTVHHKNTEKQDPVFEPALHNNSDIFKKDVAKVMEERLSTLHLDESFAELQEILNFRESQDCIMKHRCNLVTDKTTVNDVAIGVHPDVSGPLKIGNSNVDAFIMQYFEGFPMPDVAWGLINSDNQWHKLMTLNREYHNVIFNSTLIAKDIAKPLIKYMSKKFLDDTPPKITVLVGHDANIITILTALRFKSYVLTDQYENTPVGGKIVFQKWHDNIKDVDLLKVEYIYQSHKQLRNAIELSLDAPPKSITLELENCNVNQDSFCLWDDFIKFLSSL